MKYFFYFAMVSILALFFEKTNAGIASGIMSLIQLSMEWLDDKWLCESCMKNKDKRFYGDKSY